VWLSKTITQKQIQKTHTISTQQQTCSLAEIFVDNELNDVPKERFQVFYFTGTDKFRDHYKLCTDTGGDYIEKQMATHLSTLSSLKTFKCPS